MFRGRVAETIGPGIVALERNRSRGNRKRVKDGYRHADKADRHAGRHEDALVAIVSRRRL